MSNVIEQFRNAIRVIGMEPPEVLKNGESYTLSTATEN